MIKKILAIMLILCLVSVVPASADNGDDEGIVEKFVAKLTTMTLTDEEREDYYNNYDSTSGTDTTVTTDDEIVTTTNDDGTVTTTVDDDETVTTTVEDSTTDDVTLDDDYYEDNYEYTDPSGMPSDYPYPVEVWEYYNGDNYQTSYVTKDYYYNNPYRNYNNWNYNEHRSNNWNYNEYYSNNYNEQNSVNHNYYYNYNYQTPTTTAPLPSVPVTELVTRPDGTVEVVKKEYFYNYDTGSYEQLDIETPQIAPYKQEIDSTNFGTDADQSEDILKQYRLESALRVLDHKIATTTEVDELNSLTEKREELIGIYGTDGEVDEEKEEEFKKSFEKELEIELEDAFDVEDKVVINYDETSEDLKKMQERNEMRYKKMFVMSSDETALENIDGVTIINEFENGYIIEVPVDQINEVVTDDCVDKAVDEHSINKYQEMEQQRIAQDYEFLELSQEKLEVTPSEIEEAKEAGRVGLVELGVDATNPYAYYFQSVDQMPEVTTLDEAYMASASIIYLHDIDLWGTNEKWVSPNVVYSDTASMATNPSGLPVSDCEEHAISFVAMARGLGIPAEDVRVVTGYVEIDEQKYGHAWSQIKIGDKWMNVEPTSGSYIDENGEVKEVKPLGLNYYDTKIYPSLEIWSYFNDQYYVDADGGNAPEDWVITETAYSVGGAMSPTVGGYFDGIIDWISSTMYTLTN